MTPRATRSLIVLSIFVAEALLIYFLVARRCPLSGDDYSYLYEAKLFASGHLYAEDPFYDAYYAVSFRAHIATALFIFGAFLLYDANERRASPSKVWLVLSGALLG